MQSLARVVTALVLAGMSSLLAACSSPRRPARAVSASDAKPAPIAATPAAAALPPSPWSAPVVRRGDPADPIPLSIKRLVSEEQGEIHDVVALAGPVGDARGRARAQAEVTTLANDLREIEASLRASPPDSAHLDAVVVKLHRLATRIALLHEALVVATGPTSAVEVEAAAPGSSSPAPAPAH